MRGFSFVSLPKRSVLKFHEDSFVSHARSYFQEGWQRWDIPIKHHRGSCIRRILLVCLWKCCNLIGWAIEHYLQTLVSRDWRSYRISSATFFRFSSVLKEHFNANGYSNSWQVKNEGHSRFLDIQKSWKYLKNWRARAHNSKLNDN